jgi:non-canonical purine NTP pyrophosphatase (RdgB/HAM1 family)
MSERPTFITSNPSKAEQLSWHLGVELKHMAAEVPEVQSLSLAEVVEHKAKAAYGVAKGPVLVEDTSLIFNALGKLPGPLIKWFLQELDNEGLCHLLDNYEDRSAVASVLFGYYDGVTLSTFDGQMEGSIAVKPTGERGFGWDPIFIPSGYDKTWGEMTLEEQSDSSMRRIALKKLEVFLQSEVKA